MTRDARKAGATPHLPWVEICTATLCTATNQLSTSRSPTSKLTIPGFGRSKVDMAPATSEPLSYTCTCPASTTSGSVLLFYRYYSNDPQILPTHIPENSAPLDVASFHEHLASELELGGKLRFATEGFNITIGGTTAAIAAYISACVTHWSFSGLPLSTSTEREAFFKPTPGCACVFGGHASTKICAEVTPLGITDYAPASWSSVTALSPAAFHKKCIEGAKDLQLVDMRNHYESRIGYFVTGAGEVAVRPGIRRFSQWPGFVVRHLASTNKEERGEGIVGERRQKQVLTYCTGGVRCEKGARFMQEALVEEPGGIEARVFTLQGGIVGYLAWMKGEIESGQKRKGDCLFKGKNYVFDARGSMELGLMDGRHDPVAACHGCARPEDRLRSIWAAMADAIRIASLSSKMVSGSLPSGLYVGERPSELSEIIVRSCDSLRACEDQESSERNRVLAIAQLGPSICNEIESLQGTLKALRPRFHDFVQRRETSGQQRNYNESL
ncbi:hypothetical protein BU16DRAFT_623187 [Lophium mytilinum]|uniref:Rhodanese domain-containing protein n=1 Tax=Lophium mytilinum TaxID=390894 RepID=A0A6A6QA46_9PEZI|nr:hypothetical protein BU16DRAFT_623187 [Lophium mytilinum]